MPEMDGLALAREIRTHRDEAGLPLVLVTSLGRLPRARAASGFAAQLAKPIKASQLYDALVSAMTGKGAGPSPRSPPRRGRRRRLSGSSSPRTMR